MEVGVSRAADTGASGGFLLAQCSWPVAVVLTGI